MNSCTRCHGTGNERARKHRRRKRLKGKRAEHTRRQDGTLNNVCVDESTPSTAIPVCVHHHRHARVPNPDRTEGENKRRTRRGNTNKRQTRGRPEGKQTNTTQGRRPKRQTCTKHNATTKQRARYKEEHDFRGVHQTCKSVHMSRCMNKMLRDTS